MAIVPDKGRPGVYVDQSFETDIFTITPSDTEPLRVAIQALYVTVGGNVRVLNSKNETVDVMLLAGGPYYLPVARILFTGTTATGLVGVATKGLR